MGWVHSHYPAYLDNQHTHKKINVVLMLEWIMIFITIVVYMWLISGIRAEGTRPLAELAAHELNALVT